jgi:hypothetical protein
MTNQYIVFRFKKDDIDRNTDLENAEVLYVLSGDELQHNDDNKNKITIGNINIFDTEKGLTNSVDLQENAYYYVIIDSEKTNDEDTIYIFESMKITENEITTSNKILEKKMKDFFGESNMITVSNTINGIINILNEQRDIAKDYYTDFYKRKKVNESNENEGGGGPTDANENNSNENITNEGVKNLFNTYYNTVQEISNIPLLKKLTSLNEKSLKSIGINNPKDFINKILYLSEIDFSPFFNSNNSEHKKSLLFLFGMDLNNKESITIDNEFLNTKLPDPVDNEDYKFTIKRIPFATMLYQLNDNDYINKQDYTNKSLRFVIHFLQKIINDDITILRNILDKYDEDIHNKEKIKISINTAIRQKMKNNILTFLKFRNDDHSKKTYNRRFNIEIGGTQSSSTGGDNQEKLKKILKIGYNNENVKYYEKTKDGILVSNVDANGNGLYKEVGKGNLVPKKDSQYPYNYLFGEFTQIFTPDLTNQEVAKKMNILVENYKSTAPKPVFIIGYGASGAGKTSTLIHFTNPEGGEQPGILTEFCNLKEIRDVYDTIEISYKEFYQKTNNDKETNTQLGDNSKGKEGTIALKNVVNTVIRTNQLRANQLAKSTSQAETNTETATKNDTVDEKSETKIETVDGKSEDGKSETLTFKVDKTGKFTLSAGKNHPIHHRYRVQKLEDKKSEQCDEQKTHEFKEGVDLGSVVNYLIDTDRHVKATTNNPNSSRSHCLVFVKMIRKEPKKDEGNGYLIVGDFAGVENRFDCKNPNVLADFMNIKKPGKDELFYEDEKCCDGEIDPIGPVDLCNSGENKNTGDDSIDNGDVSDPELYEVSDSVEDTASGPVKEIANTKKRPRIFGLTTGPDNEDLASDNQKGGAVSNINTSNVNKLPVYNSEDTEVDNLIKEKYNDIFNGSIPNIGEKYRKLLDLLVGKNKIDVKDVGNDGVETYVKKHIQTQWNEAKTYYENIDKQIKDNKESMEFEKIKKNLKLPSKLTLGSMDKLSRLTETDKIEAVINHINKWNETLSTFVRNKQTDENIYRFVELNNNGYTDNSRKRYTNESLTANTELDDAVIEKLSNYVSFRGKPFPVPLITTTSAVNTISKEDIPNPELVIEIPQVDNNATKEMNDKISSVDKAITKMNEEIVSLKKKAINLDDDNNSIQNQIDNNVFTSTYKELFEDGPEEYKIEEFVAFVRDMEYNRLQKEKVGDVVCTNRRVEGEYINDSLRELRDEIKHIMTIKNKDALSVMPNYIDICFDQYCPDHKDCFGFDSQITKDTIPPINSASNTSIMGAVRNFLTDSGYGNDEKINKDILISIFCVFNISRMANNPPPVPYVDINKLKRLYYYGDIFGKDMNEFVEEGNELIHTLREEYKDTYIDEGATEQKQKDLADYNNKYQGALETHIQGQFKKYLKDIVKTKDTQIPFYEKNFLKIFKNGKEATIKGYKTHPTYRAIQNKYAPILIPPDTNKQKLDTIIFDVLNTSLSYSLFKVADKEKKFVINHHDGNPFIDKYEKKFKTDYYSKKPVAETVYKTTNKLQNILDNKEKIDNEINIDDLRNKETMIETFDGILGILSYRNVMAKTGESAINRGFTGGADENLKDMFIACLKYLLFKRKLFLELTAGDRSSAGTLKKLNELKTTTTLNTNMPTEVQDLVMSLLEIKYDATIHIKKNIDHTIDSTDSGNYFLYIRKNSFDYLIKKDIIEKFAAQLYKSIKKIDNDKLFVQYIKEIVEKPEKKNVDNLYNIFHTAMYTDEIENINNKRKKTEKEIEYLNQVITNLSKKQEQKETKDTHLISSTLLTEIKNYMKEKNNNENKKSNAEQLLISKEITKEYIKKVLDFVDNNNAISAIGTLEFLDKMAKLDSVGLTTCNYDELGDDKRILTDDYEYKKQWKADYEKDFKFSPLYQVIKVKGGKKTSKSLKHKKKRVNQTKKKREKH